jgi:copper chaperone
MFMKEVALAVLIVVVIVAAFWLLIYAQSSTGLTIENSQKSPLSQPQSSAELKVVKLSVSGMMCEKCVANVTGRLMGVIGVASANVSLEDKSAIVVYDPSKAGIEEMTAAVNSSGKFKADVMPEVETAKFKINGMMCEGCAIKTREIIEGVSGVRSANVSFEDKQAIVVYDPGKTSTDDIIAAVGSSPKYTAELIS